MSGGPTCGAPERAPRTESVPVRDFRAMYLADMRRSAEAVLRQLPGALVWYEESDARQHTVALFVLNPGASLAWLYIDGREKDRRELTTRAARLDVLMEMEIRGYVPAIPGGITLAALIEAIKTTADAESAAPAGHPAR